MNHFLLIQYNLIIEIVLIYVIYVLKHLLTDQKRHRNFHFILLAIHLHLAQVFVTYFYKSQEFLSDY